MTSVARYTIFKGKLKSILNSLMNERSHSPYLQMADTLEKTGTLSHEREALQDKQELEIKTFSELAQCLARIRPKITLHGRLFKYNYVGCVQPSV